jgi:hypothetical protein
MLSERFNQPWWEQAIVENQKVLKWGLTEIVREDVDWVLLSEVGFRWLAFTSPGMDLEASFKHGIFFTGSMAMKFASDTLHCGISHYQNDYQSNNLVRDLR